jgi:hypothetical protein
VPRVTAMAACPPRAIPRTVKDRNASCVPVTVSASYASTRTDKRRSEMSATTDTTTTGGARSNGRLRQASGVGRLVRRIERERRAWSRRPVEELPTEQAWRAGVAEGLRLAQVAIRKGV